MLAQKIELINGVEGFFNLATTERLQKQMKILKCFSTLKHVFDLLNNVADLPIELNIFVIYNLVYDMFDYQHFVLKSI